MVLKMKKHCFVQKPLTHSIHEARVLAQLAKESGVATEMGNQGTANEGLRKAAALVKAGALGDVKEVHVWTDRPIWPQGENRPATASAARQASLGPLWLAGARARPYAKKADSDGSNRSAYVPFNWRGWWDFGSGALGDMACHTFNMPFAIASLRDPTAVQAETSGHNGDSHPSGRSSPSISPPTPKVDRSKAFLVRRAKRRRRSSCSKSRDDSATTSAPRGQLLVGTKGKLYSPGD